MPWFKVDDGFALHTKVVVAGNSAMGLWVRAGTWSAQQLTDGYVPVAIARTMGRTGDARRLVDVGLWESAEGGYQFHDWLDYNPSAADVRADQRSKHEARMRAGRSGGIASGVARRKQNGSRTEAEPKQNEAPSRPVPSRTKTQPPAAASAEPSGADPPPAQALLAEWIEHCGDRPPSRVVGHVAKELAAMLGEGIPPGDVRAGLAAWHGRGLHPSALASVVHEHRTATQRTPRPDPRQAHRDGIFDRAMAAAQERERNTP